MREVRALPFGKHPIVQKSSKPPPDRPSQRLMRLLVANVNGTRQRNAESFNLPQRGATFGEKTQMLPGLGLLDENSLGPHNFRGSRESHKRTF